MSARRISDVEPSTQSSRVAATISMMVRTPRPSSPRRWATVPLSSSSLEALDRLPSLSLSRTTSSWLREPSGSTRGTTKQVTPAGGLGQHEEHVVHRRGGEPLVPVQGVLAVDRRGPGLGDVGADVGAALLLGHPHPRQRAALLRGEPDAGVVGRRGQQRRPLLGQRLVGGIGPQRGDRGVRHRDRAAVARLGVRPGHEAGGAAHVGAGAVLLPGGRGEAVPDGALHQPVPRGVEGDLVDPVAVAVVRRQLRVVPVGEHPVLAGLGRPGLRAEGGEVLDDLGARVTGDGLDEGQVAGDDVVTDQWRRLVGGHPDVARGKRRHVATVGPCLPRRPAPARSPTSCGPGGAGSARCSGG